jgi:SAM-dependent methyltransferase
MPEYLINTNFEAAKKFVEMKREHAQESLSGPGSWLENAGDAIDFINSSINKFNMKTILDLGCGDWNWFKYVALHAVDYIGWDADESMIKENSLNFGQKNIRFYVKDIVTEEFPEVDLIICRDVLFHMKKNLAVKVIEKAKLTCKYFIATSFRDVKLNTGPNRYTNFDNWGYYNINLNIEPFLLAANEIEYIQEKNIKVNGKSRYICLYEF